VYSVRGELRACRSRTYQDTTNVESNETVEITLGGFGEVTSRGLLLGGQSANVTEFRGSAWGRLIIGHLKKKKY
jgi:hypothetical protein